GVRLLVWRYDQLVGTRVEGQHGDVDLPVERHVALEVASGGRVGGHARGGVDRGQVTGKVQARPRVQVLDLAPVRRAGEQVAVVHTGVPGGVPARAALELGPEAEYEQELDLQLAELVLLLRGVVGGRGRGRG